MCLGTKVGNYSSFDYPMQQFWNTEKTKNTVATKKERMRDLKLFVDIRDYGDDDGGGDIPFSTQFTR